MDPFSDSSATRIVRGRGSIARIGELCAGLGAGHVFLVTDSGIVGSGHVEPVKAALADSGLRFTLFDAVRENPSTEDVQRALDALGPNGADLWIGLGGGSSIDVAKGSLLLAALGGSLEDWWGPVAKDDGEAAALPPLVAVPTTAGTGTEVQSYALIGQIGTHQKMACGHAGLAPRLAILDPNLTVSMPPEVTAFTGLDAIGHAVETAVTKPRNERSERFSQEAFVRLTAALERVLTSPGDLDAREAMLEGSTLAGLAIEHSMLGAAHAMANPLTAHHGLAHGLAVGLALPAVVAFNAEDAAARTAYAGLARAASLVADDAVDSEAAAALATHLHDLLVVAGLAPSLADHGVPRGSIPAMAEEAARQWTASFNPRPVGAPELQQLYERCF